MEVSRKNTPVIKEFSEVLEGAVFEYLGVYYMKIREAENYGNIGVNLVSGVVIRFNKSDFVRPVKGRFVEE